MNDRGVERDPFTVEIIRDQLIAAAEESFIRLGRSSQSPIIYEVLDYACALTDAGGELIAQANGVPGFLGTLTFAVKAVLESFPPTLSNPVILLSATIPTPEEVIISPMWPSSPPFLLEASLSPSA